MGKLLLTSSQVQVLLSSTLVAAITFFLFLAGYTIQQHSIASIHQQLRPRIPLSPASQTPQQPFLRPSRHFTNTPSNDEAQPIDWRSLAHVQLVSSHHAVCSALMILADLHRLKSPARRILFFPVAWARDKQAAKHDLHDPYLDITRRLLRRAARRYNVELHPITPWQEGGNEEDEAAYGEAVIWGLRDVQRALVLQSPGMINDAGPLDSLLAFSDPGPLSLLQNDAEANIAATDMVLLQPGPDVSSVLTASATIAQVPDFSSVASILPFTVFPPSESILVRSIGSLHNATSLNKTEFSQTPYLRFSDPKLPGPEWEVDYARVVEARPKDKDADWLWTKSYGEFAGRRYEVCGLGLEAWRGE